MLSASHSISRHVVGIIGRSPAMLQRGDDMLSGCYRKIGRVPVNPKLIRQVHCDGKDRMPNPRVARQVAARMRGRRDGARVQAYRCPFCEHWHVGSVPSSRAPDARR